MLDDGAAIRVDVGDFNSEAQRLTQDLAATGPQTMIVPDVGRAEVPGRRPGGTMAGATLPASMGKVRP